MSVESVSRLSACTVAVRRVLGLGGSTSRITRTMLSKPLLRSVAESNGSAPVSNSYRITPSE
jgi:hypothetical protein